ncbi:MAG: hypothetical protein FE78DRAFT_540515 [Acidomyces sp. 'richmondensis']|nr:MAG: hypothetical protein FE78DRAFT_540515 [Acidomyces sp. 'richmondensis']
MLEEGPITALGFVDNTNILTFRKTIEENCQRLEAAHAPRSLGRYKAPIGPLYKESSRERLEPDAITLEAKARHLYTAVVRPAITYRYSVWTQTAKDIGSYSRQTKALEKIQNQALRHVIGAYKSVLEAVLQNEADIPPLALYT